jgi:repressor LexA
METIGEKIKLLRKNKDGMTQPELAKLLGVEPPAVSKYETNRVPVPQDTIRKLSIIFGVSTDYLLGLDKETSTFTVDYDKTFTDAKMDLYNSIHEAVKIPVLGKISAGLPIMATEHIIGYEFVSKSLLLPNRDYFYLLVTGDSMNQKFQDGNLVLIQRQDSVDNGDIAVVLINGYDATVKKFVRSNDVVTLVPMSNNSEHLPQMYNLNEIDINIIGKVTAFQGKL